MSLKHQLSFKTEFIHYFFLRISNVVFFAVACRCQDAEAFELSSSGFTNGVFVKFLKKRLLDDEKITVVLDRVAEGEKGTETHYIIMSYVALQEALI